MFHTLVQLSFDTRAFPELQGFTSYIKARRIHQITTKQALSLCNFMEGVTKSQSHVST